MKLVVVTGLSGAGKSQALRALEDMGFYCVDNLPPMLIPNMARLCMEHGNLIDKVALGIDTRSGAFFGETDEALDELLAMNIHYDIIYLNASDEELICAPSPRRWASSPIWSASATSAPILPRSASTCWAPSRSTRWRISA